MEEPAFETLVDVLRWRAVCAPGDRALLFFQPGLDYIAAFFGWLVSLLLITVGFASLILFPSLFAIFKPKFLESRRKEHALALAKGLITSKRLGASKRINVSTEGSVQGPAQVRIPRGRKPNANQNR